VKAGRTMVGSAVAGHSKFLLKRRIGVNEVGCGPGSDHFAGQWPCAQRSISADSLFGYFCGDIRRSPLEYLKKTNHNEKRDWPSRGQERVYAQQCDSVTLRDY